MRDAVDRLRHGKEPAFASPWEVTALRKKPSKARLYIETRVRRRGTKASPPKLRLPPFRKAGADAGAGPCLSGSSKKPRDKGICGRASPKPPGVECRERRFFLNTCDCRKPALHAIPRFRGGTFRTPPAPAFSGAATKRRAMARLPALSRRICRPCHGFGQRIDTNARYVLSIDPIGQFETRRRDSSSQWYVWFARRLSPACERNYYCAWAFPVFPGQPSCLSPSRHWRHRRRSRSRTRSCSRC